MRKNPTDKQKLAEIYREVVACHYYSDGADYCANLLGISVKYVRRISDIVREKRIVELNRQGATNEEIAKDIGFKQAKAEGLIRTALKNERAIRWTA